MEFKILYNHLIYDEIYKNLQIIDLIELFEIPEFNHSVTDYLKRQNLNWEFISENFELSENFIREFSERVDWRYIPHCQALTEDFREEMLNNPILYEHIYKNYFLQYVFELFDKPEFKHSVTDYLNRENLNWEYISKNAQLSPNFKKEFHQKLTEKQ